MPFRLEGTERFGNLTAYRIGNPDTGDSFYLEDPAEVQQVTGAPVPAEPEMANFLGPDIGAPKTPDRRLAMAEPMGESTGSTTPAPKPAERADVKPQMVANEADDDGLVFMDEEPAAGGQAPSGGTQPQQQQMYPSNTRYPIGIPAPQLQNYRMARREAGFSPTTEKTKGDPGTVADLRLRAANLLDAQQATAEADAEIRAQQAVRARNQNELLAQRNLEKQREERKRLAEAQDWQTKRLAELDADSNALASKQVDQNRWYKSAGPGGIIVAALAQGAGAAGASLGGGPNYAMQLIDNFIAADIENQKEEWRSASDRLKVKQNAYARELENGLSPQAAEKKLELLENQAVEYMLRDDDLVRTLEAIGVDTAKVQNDYAEKNLNLRAKLEELLGKEAEFKFHQASGGGVNYRQYLQDLKLYGETNAAVGEGTGLFPPESVQLELAKRDRENSGLGPSGFAPGTKQSEAEVNEVMKSVADKRGITLSRLHLQAQRVREKMGAMIQKYGGEVPGRGLTEDWLPQLLGEESADARALEREVNQLINFSVRDESGAVLGEMEKADKAAMVAARHANASVTDEEVIRATSGFLEQVDSAWNGVMAGHRPEAVAEYERRLQERQRGNRIDLSQEGSGFEPVE